MSLDTNVTAATGTDYGSCLCSLDLYPMHACAGCSAKCHIRQRHLPSGLLVGGLPCWFCVLLEAATNGCMNAVNVVMLVLCRDRYLCGARAQLSSAGHSQRRATTRQDGGRLWSPWVARS